MNAEMLLAHYDRIADAPDAVARLRRFVLDLAVRGKLVPQDAGDEPATAAIRRLGGPAIQDGAFELPSTWCWVQVGDVAHTRLGKMLDKEKNKGTPRPYLRNINVRWFGFDLSDLLEMPFEDKELEEFCLTHGDVMICEGGEPGRAAVWRSAIEGVYFQKAIHRVRFFKIVDPDFFVHALKSSADDGRLHEYFTGSGIKHFTGKGLSSYQFPLPPLAEQRRIVAKVDELMALCDQLEVARAAREETRDRMAAASLARLNNPDPETFPTDAHFALNALPALTTRPDQVKQLRQTILNLAVRGKLVPHSSDSNELNLFRVEITEAKRRLKRKTGDTRIKDAPSPRIQDFPIQLPIGWVTESFENLFLFIDYRGRTPDKKNSGVPLITAKNVKMGFMSMEAREYISESDYDIWMTRGFPRVGDLLFTTEAPLGNVCVNQLHEPFALAQRVICLQPYIELDTRFVMFALMSDVMRKLVETNATGMTAKGIKSANLKPLPIPIPPPSEQRRIVAKVNELMALCDALEAALTSASATRARLLEATLQAALAPAAALANAAE